MKTIYSSAHHQQRGRGELNDGRVQPCFEKPERAEMVLAAIRAAALGDVLAPRSHEESLLNRVHDPALLRFLGEAWSLWVAEHGADVDALPLIWPTRHFRQIEPAHIDGRLSYFAFDAGTPITAGTWAAACAAVDVARSGCDLIAESAPAVFSLCRPPGHHAARDTFGGYCFLNNAAIAVEDYLERGADRVALLDIDYHHGNGSQSIFYHRADVLFASIHADPRFEFPYFLGYADEMGAGPGEGYNLNLPLPFETDFAAWSVALEVALRRIRDFAPEVLVVSLGLDTYAGDPISRFRLQTEDYARVGAALAGLRLPTHFVFEGGYAVEQLGLNTVKVLGGFEARD